MNKKKGRQKLSKGEGREAVTWADGKCYGKKGKRGPGRPIPNSSNSIYLLEPDGKEGKGRKKSVNRRRRSDR